MHAFSVPLQEGLSHAAAGDYALALAQSKGLPLKAEEAGEIAQATAGHPLLITNIVARTRRRERQALLEEVRRHEGDFAAQVEAAYDWSAKNIGEAGPRPGGPCPSSPPAGCPKPRCTP